MPSKLFAEGVLIGFLSPHKELDIDWPRYYFEFEPTKDYERYRDILDLRGNACASRKQMKQAAKLDLRMESPDGELLKLEFIFLDENKRLAVIREGLVRRS